ncbi:MAG: Uma2 family endonuclease [Acaryochloridaceae cyanobacterium RU_4_10]|nr:Uma2 family endonuclease [Acaryochloridaceae cyanobacterium RU_4_10]
MVTSSQTITLKDFLQRSNIEASPAWEFIHGESIQKNMPTIDHSILQKRLVAAIDATNSGYEAFPELRCVLQHNSVVPDIAIVRCDRLPPNNQPIEGAPDWLIEILSPDQSTTKLIEKIQICLNEGTQLGWLMDSTEQVVIVLRPSQSLVFLRQEDMLPSLENIPLALTVDRVFGWLQRKG